MYCLKVLKTLATCIRCYWFKPASSRSQLQMLQSSLVQPDSSTGENIRILANLYLQLCIACLSTKQTKAKGVTFLDYPDSTIKFVSPGDITTVAEGLIALHEQHDLFNVPWFQHNYCMGLLAAVLRLYIVPSSLGMVEGNTINSGGSIEKLLKGLLLGRVKYSCEVSSQNNSNNLLTVKEIWQREIGQEMLRISGEYGCTEECTVIVHQATSCIESLSALENLETLSGQLIMYGIQPVVAEIARRL